MMFFVFLRIVNDLFKKSNKKRSGNFGRNEKLDGNTNTNKLQQVFL